MRRPGPRGIRQSLEDVHVAYAAVLVPAKALTSGTRVCGLERAPGGEAFEGNFSSNLTIRFSDDGLVGVFNNAVFVNERGFQQPLGTVRFRRETP